MSFQRSDVSSQLWKTRAKHCPDLVLDLVRFARAVDQHDAIWFARCQVAISSPNALIKLSRLLFHSIRRARLLLHSRFRCGGVDIEDESDIRDAIADHKCIQALDHFAIQASRRTLINSCGIEETICDHAKPSLESRLDRLTHELALARFEEEQLGFRRHRGIVRRKLKQFANCFTDRCPTWLA